MEKTTQTAGKTAIKEKENGVFIQSQEDLTKDVWMIFQNISKGGKKQK